MAKKLSNVKAIITHPGMAHRDDLFAAALSIFWMLFHWDTQCEVSRRDPTPEEVEDPSILILDTGGLFDPKKMVFDHHQFSREEGRGQCALTLLLKWLDPQWFEFEMAKSTNTGRSWLEDLALFDSVGPVQAKAAGAPTGSLTDTFLVRQFQDTPNGLAMQVAVDFWDWRHSQYKNSQKIKEWCEKNPCIINDHIAVIPPCDEFTPFQLIASYEHNWSDHDPAVVVFHDDRGPGWGVLRRNDTPGYDFASLEGHEDVLFAHKGGFIFKTKERIDLEEVIKLIKLGMS